MVMIPFMRIQKIQKAKIFRLVLTGLAVFAVALPGPAIAQEALTPDPGLSVQDPDGNMQAVEQPMQVPEVSQAVPQAEPVPTSVPAPLLDDGVAGSVLAVPQDVVTPMPEQDGLVSPAQAVAEQNIPEIPGLPGVEAEPVDENLFYDADDVVSPSEMRSIAPRKLNPAMEPGSKYIVVTKDASPGSRQARLVSAQRAIKLGRYDSALRLFDDLYEANKRDPEILLGRAVALQNIGLEEEALVAYEELLQLRPDHTQAQINMLGLLGRRYPAVALQRLMELHDDNPENMSVVAQIALMQAEVGHYREALEYLGVAAATEPKNANHLFNMAVIADRSGNKEEAVKFYEQALETDAIYGGSRSIPRESVFERLGQLR